MDKKPVVLPVKTRSNTVKCELGFVEIPQDGGFVGHGHGQVMVRFLPAVIFQIVAIPAFSAADKCWRRA